MKPNPNEFAFETANLRGGDTVEYHAYAGMGRNGPEYRVGRGKVNRLLVFPDHVVLNIGGKHGTPAVVNGENFIRVVRRGSAATVTPTFP